MVVWNLEDIYKFKDTDKLIHDLGKRVEDFKKIRSKLNKDISVKEFMSIIKKKEEIAVLMHKLSAYASLQLSENTSDSKRIAHETKIAKICTEFGNEMIFFGLWFKNLSDNDAKKYIANSGKYKYYLEVSRLFKPYMLKENEEKIINLKDLTGSDTVSSIYEIITNNFTFNWKNKKVSRDELMSHIFSKKRSERKKAYDLLFKRYEKEEIVLGEIYNSIVNDWKNENMTIRGFKSQIGVRNLLNEVPDESVTALLNVVKRNSEVFREYFKLKGKILGINMDRYDIYASFNEKKNKYSYDTCKKITLESYKEFSEEMYLCAKKIFDEKHVHSELLKNKRSGAFCAGIDKDITPYILLNHTGKLEDVYTLMHETGHAIHNILSKNNTNFTYYPSLTLAETASVFGELILSKKLLKDASIDDKKRILLKTLDGYYATIIRQTYFTLFEIKAHELISKGATVDEINNVYLENLNEQFKGAIKVPEIFKHEWKNIPHIYFSPFYCYSYAFGNLLVLSLYKRYEKEGEKFVEKYLKILSYGGAKAPKDILKDVGIDITLESFWEEGFDLIKEDIKELKKLT